jgi:poly(3-hydroxybutyrate) depolymerase
MKLTALVLTLCALACDASDSTDPPDEWLDGEPGEYVYTFEGRGYHILIPSGYTSDTEIPLVLAFHGACKSGTEFYDHEGIEPFKQAAEPASFILVVPDTKGGCEIGGDFCADFVRWPPSCEPDLATAPQIVGEMDGLVALIDELGHHWRLDRARVHAMGHSDGGLFTAMGGLTHSDVFASLTIFSMGWGNGYPLVEPDSDRRLPVQLICGGDDTDFCNAAQESEPFLASQGHPTRLMVIPGEGHGLADLVNAVTVPELFGWMSMSQL